MKKVKRKTFVQLTINSKGYGEDMSKKQTHKGEKNNTVVNHLTTTDNVNEETTKAKTDACPSFEVENNTLTPFGNISVFNKLIQAPIYNFFKGIPPLSTILFTCVTAVLFFLIRFLYYLFRVGYLATFNINPSYVNFSESTFLSIALTAIIAIATFSIINLLIIVWRHNRWYGWILTYIIFVVITFLLAINAGLSNLIVNILFSLICGLIFMFLPLIICFILQIKDWIQNIKHNKSSSLSSTNSKLIKNSKISKNKKTSSSSVLCTIILVIIVLSYFPVTGYFIAKDKKEFNIIQHTDLKTYAVIAEYNDRYVCVEVNISENHGELLAKLNLKKQKQIPIAETEYEIYKFSNVE